MSDRFRLGPGTPETRALLGWVEEQIAREQREWETGCETNERSQYLRGRLSAWRRLQALAKPPPEATIDGKAV